MKAKRNLFKELAQGIRDIKSYEKGKITLRTWEVKPLKPMPQVSSQDIRTVREKLHLSRNVFALRLRVSPRTLEKWEQGVSKPNVQAAALILMIKKYPETLDKLASL